MKKMNPKVDGYLKRAEKWQEEMTLLRAILLDSGLTEEMKWGKPCYTFEGTNIVLIIGFKNHCILLFAKGALLKDPKGILIKAGENTQAARQARFTSVQEITKLEPALKAYIREAISAEKAGLKVEYKKNTEIVFVEEFQKILDKNPALNDAFQALTPGRRRAYHMFFAAPKQSATRVARVEKCVKQILEGKGLNDEYRAVKK